MISAVLSPFLQNAGALVLSGSERPTGATMEAVHLLLELLPGPGECPVFVGADQGVEALVRSRLPTALVFKRQPGTILAAGARIPSGVAHRLRREEAGYAQACVGHALSACPNPRAVLWIAFPDDLRPTRLLPSPQGEECFPRLRSAVWGRLALALGCGMRGLVYLPGLMGAPGSWGFTYAREGWWYAAHDVLDCAHSAASVGDPRFCDANARLEAYEQRTVRRLLKALEHGKTALQSGLVGHSAVLFDACQQALAGGESLHECALLLWRLWFDAHPPMLAYARTFSGFRDPLDGRGGEIFAPEDPYPRPGRGMCAAAAVAALVGDRRLRAPFEAIYQRAR